MVVRTAIVGALALIVTPAATQELTPFQRQVLDGAKKTLAETVRKFHAVCDSSNTCETMRVDILDEVLEHWENTPPYGKYAVDVMIWQNKRVRAIGEMSNNYVALHGRLDAGFENELAHRRAADPATFDPPKEYLCRHMFGTPHLYGSQGEDLCK